MLFEEENTSAFLKNCQEVEKTTVSLKIVKKEELLYPRLPNLRMQYLQKLS